MTGRSPWNRHLVKQVRWRKQFLTILSRPSKPFLPGRSLPCRSLLCPALPCSALLCPALPCSVASCASLCLSVRSLCLPVPLRASPCLSVPLRASLCLSVPLCAVLCLSVPSCGHPAPWPAAPQSLSPLRIRPHPLPAVSLPGALGNHCNVGPLNGLVMAAPGPRRDRKGASGRAGKLIDLALLQSARTAGTSIWHEWSRAASPRPLEVSWVSSPALKVSHPLPSAPVAFPWAPVPPGAMAGFGLLGMCAASQCLRHDNGTGH